MNGRKINRFLKFDVLVTSMPLIELNCLLPSGVCKVFHENNVLQRALLNFHAINEFSF